MTSRFQRGKIGAISPFFAFQDIITSAMAVLIAIIMLLALYMGEPDGAESGGGEASASSTLREELRLLLDELTSANEELAAAEAMASASTADPTLLRGSIALLHREIDLLREHRRSDQATLQTLERPDAAAPLQGDLARRQAALQAAAAELKKREEEAARSLSAMQEREREVQAQEAALLAEQAQKNQLWLIPDRSQTTKEAVLAVVSGDEVTLQRFDQPEKETLRGSSLVGGFAKALKRFSSLDQYLVFYFRPSGAEHFKSLTAAAREKGFEIGYDAIDEELVLNFGAAP